MRKYAYFSYISCNVYTGKHISIKCLLFHHYIIAEKKHFSLSQTFFSITNYPHEMGTCFLIFDSGATLVTLLVLSSAMAHQQSVPPDLLQLCLPVGSQEALDRLLQLRQELDGHHHTVGPAVALSHQGRQLCVQDVPGFIDALRGGRQVWII